MTIIRKPDELLVHVAWEAARQVPRHVLTVGDNRYGDGGAAKLRCRPRSRTVRRRTDVRRARSG
ncbi:hypothetical protein [Streptomyces sp. NPDC006368]|uniref:hypothetical protein n=1 Tax=Streptomyces sp. NPDC006368 TaxID=3156760 RepID=UPI00339FCA5E